MPRSLPEAAGRSTPTRVELVYDEHVDDVARWAARLAGPSIEVEDLVQEIFLVVAQKLGEFRGDSKLSTWLFSITSNVVRSHRRRSRWRRFVSSALGDPVDELASSYPTPVEVLEQRRRQALLYRVLDRMPERSREILILCDIEGLSGADVAELLGITEGAVWTRLHRARTLLADRVRKTPEYKREVES